MKRGLGALASVGSTAPFVGLFGTVMGIVNAFGEIGKTGSAGFATVSAGIAEALVTTAFGIGVAIPAVMLFNYFTSRVEEVATDITESASALIDHLRKRS
jgi:biopolymer transport protein ExbB/TolQ